MTGRRHHKRLCRKLWRQQQSRVTMAQRRKAVRRIALWSMRQLAEALWWEAMMPRFGG